MANRRPSGPLKIQRARRTTDTTLQLAWGLDPDADQPGGLHKERPALFEDVLVAHVIEDDPSAGARHEPAEVRNGGRTLCHTGGGFVICGEIATRILYAKF